MTNVMAAFLFFIRLRLFIGRMVAFVVLAGTSVTDSAPQQQPGRIRRRVRAFVPCFPHARLS